MNTDATATAELPYGQLPVYDQPADSTFQRVTLEPVNQSINNSMPQPMESLPYSNGSQLPMSQIPAGQIPMNQMEMGQMQNSMARSQQNPAFLDSEYV